jgi:hypothetical protein
MSKSVYRYDTSANTWSQLAGYPLGVGYQACAGILGEIVCAGGWITPGAIKSTYIYDPASNTWSQGADMPYGDYAMASSGANDKLQIAGGNSGGTNAAIEYDPATNAWKSLPNVNYPEAWGYGSCGFYKIGGVAGYQYQSTAEVLPGYDQCDGRVTWLSENMPEFDVARGQSVTVSLRMDSGVVAQPGDYLAKLSAETNTPYPMKPVQVTMHVNPPKTWGKIAGTVTDSKSGTPIAGATVQIGTDGGKGKTTFTLKTDDKGHYQLWLNAKYSPLQVIVGKAGYVPQVKTVKLAPRSTTTLNVALAQT